MGAFSRNTREAQNSHVAVAEGQGAVVLVHVDFLALEAYILSEDHFYDYNTIAFFTLSQRREAVDLYAVSVITLAVSLSFQSLAF